MSDENQETIVDIAREMRNWWPHDPLKYPYPEEADNKDLCSFADRIEAAWKREKSQSWHQREMEELVLRHEKEVIELKKQSGNAAAMRDALKKIAAMDIPHNFQNERFDIADNCYDLTHAIKEARAVLSAPPRNCDVGKAEEQTERFKLFCNRRECVTCELNRRSPFRFGCFSAWAQMPYEAKKGGVK